MSDWEGQKILITNSRVLNWMVWIRVLLNSKDYYPLCLSFSLKITEVNCTTKIS